MLHDGCPDPLRLLPDATTTDMTLIVRLYMLLDWITRLDPSGHGSLIIPSVIMKDMFRLHDFIMKK